MRSGAGKHCIYLFGEGASHSQRMSKVRGGGGLENQEKLGGGRVFFSNLDVRILKKFKNKFLFACILTLLPIVKLALDHSRKDPQWVIPENIHTTPMEEIGS